MGDEESPHRPLTFQDFMAPSKAGRKRRTLPIAPHLRRRSKEEGEEEGEERGWEGERERRRG